MMYKNILPKEQQKIYSLLKFANDYNFILFGGTAIALQIGHRISIDFDFFSLNKLDNKMKKNILNNLNSDLILQDEENTLVYMKNNVKLSFFGDMHFANNDNSFMIDDTLRVANIQSLLATKLKATFDRSEYKDYIDIIELLKRVDLKNGIKLSNDFFSNLSVSQLLKNLVYFDDGDLYKLTKDDKDFLIKNVNNYIEENNTQKNIKMRRK